MWKNTYVPVRQLTADWHELRKDRITASVAPGCMGVHPYMTPRKAWRIIVEGEECISNWYMLHGREMEPVAVSLYEQETGHLCRECGFFFLTDHPWLGASPDRTVGKDGLLEVKCSGLEHDCPSPHWVMQAQVQLICTGREWCDLVHYREGIIQIWRVDRSGLEQLFGRLLQWYTDHVETKKCPEKRSRHHRQDDSLPKA